LLFFFRNTYNPITYPFGLCRLTVIKSSTFPVTQYAAIEHGTWVRKNLFTPLRVLDPVTIPETRPYTRWAKSRYTVYSTECSTCYLTRHFFNNSKTNEDIVTKFEQEYVPCLRNEEECVCSVCL